MENKATQRQEQLQFARARVSAYRNVQLTFARRMEELEIELAEVKGKREFLQNTMREIDGGALVRAERELAELELAQQKREAALVSGTGLSKEANALAKLARLQAEMDSCLEILGDNAPNAELVAILTRKLR